MFYLQSFAKKQLSALWVVLLLASFAFPTDLVVSGLTGSYSTVNGKYILQGTFPRSGVQYWKHETLGYFIYFDNMQDIESWTYW